MKQFIVIQYSIDRSPWRYIWFKSIRMVDYQKALKSFLAFYGEVKEEVMEAGDSDARLFTDGKKRIEVVENYFKDIKGALTFLWRSTEMQAFRKRADYLNWTTTDDSGDMVACYEGRLELSVHGDTKARIIGMMTIDGNYIKGSRKTPLRSEVHKYHTANSWNVNRIVSQKMPETARVVFHTDQGSIQITKKEITEKKFSIYHKEGYEEQIIIPEQYWTKI